MIIFITFKSIIEPAEIVIVKDILFIYSQAFSYIGFMLVIKLYYQVYNWEELLHLVY